MKVGFTGTREGCTPAQGGWLARFFRDSEVTEFRHGCAVGADTEAVSHASNFVPKEAIHGHPCDLQKFTHPTALALSGVVHPRKPPLDRNRDIVNACEVLVACPGGPEELRSGTWSTVRWARKQGRRILIVWSDGKVTEEGPKSERVLK